MKTTLVFRSKAIFLCCLCWVFSWFMVYSLIFSVFSLSQQQAQTIGDLSISQALGLARDQFLKTLSASSSGRAAGGDGY